MQYYVRVTRTSIRDDPVDPGDIHSRDMDRVDFPPVFIPGLEPGIDKTIETR